MIVAGLACARIAAAQGTATAEAEQLFREGKRLMGERRFAEACAAFEASQKIEANVVTKLRLADCRELNGQLATAWGLFLQVESDTRRDPALAPYHQKARERSAIIEPRLSYLIINVADGSRTDGLTISRDGVALDEGKWNRALPIDGGEHVIEAKARGREPWTARVTVRAESDKQSVDVPRFDDAAAATQVGGGAAARIGGTAGSTDSPGYGQAADEPKPASDVRATPARPMRRGGRGTALAIGAVGVIAIGAGVGFELSSRGAYDKSKAEPDDDRQADLYGSANRKHRIAQGLALGGVGLTAAGAFLWWRGGQPVSRVAVMPAPGGGATVAFGGSF